MPLSTYSKHLLYISTAIILSAVVVLLLAWNSGVFTTPRSGFDRRFTNSTAEPLNILKQPQELKSIAGASKNHLYFQTGTPGSIFITDKQLQNQAIVQFNLPADKKTTSLIRCVVDSPKVYFFCGNVPAVFIYDLNTESSVKYNVPKSVFSRAVALSENQFIFRGFDPSIKTKDKIFIKSNTSLNTIELEKFTSKRTGDGGMMTDGLLHFDPLTNSLVYTYFYSNGILKMDTNLNLVSTFHTIDTFSTFQAKIGGVQSGTSTKYTHVGPARFVNKLNSVCAGFLYNNSGITADNEKNGRHKHNFVIDMYDLKNGAYVSSFYIPKYKDEYMKGLEVHDNLIVILYENHIATYPLPANYH